MHPKILIVDDDGLNIYALQLLLENIGISSDYAINGEIAIKKIFDRQNSKNCKCYYQLILMDCNMPIMDGYFACRKLKEYIQRGVLQNTKIVACTADVTQNNIKKCKDSGFEDIFLKPILKDKLIQILQQTIGF